MDASNGELSIMDWDESHVHNLLCSLGFPQYQAQIRGLRPGRSQFHIRRIDELDRTQYLRRRSMSALARRAQGRWGSHNRPETIHPQSRLPDQARTQCAHRRGPLHPTL